MSESLPPIAISNVLGDPDLIQRLLEANGPYFPVQRYFENAAQYRSSTGSDRMIIAPNFRGDWAYDEPKIEGVEPLLFHEGFAEAAGVTGIFLSKLDGTARGGMVVAIRQQTEIPVKLIGVGETPDDVQPFDPDRFVEAMFEETINAE